MPHSIEEPDSPRAQGPKSLVAVQLPSSPNDGMHIMLLSNKEALALPVPVPAKVPNHGMYIMPHSIEDTGSPTTKDPRA